LLFCVWFLPTWNVLTLCPLS